MNFYRVVVITSTDLKFYKLISNSYSTSKTTLTLTFHKQFIKNLLTAFCNLVPIEISKGNIFVFIGGFEPLIKERIKSEIAARYGNRGMWFDFSNGNFERFLLAKTAQKNELIITFVQNRLYLYYNHLQRLSIKYIEITDLDRFQASEIFKDLFNHIYIDENLDSIKFLNFDENFELITSILPILEAFFPFAKLSFDERDEISIAFA